MFYSNFQKTIALLVGVVAMALAISYFVFAWTEPTQAPPGGNVPAPLNVGSAGQSKAGGLILNTGEAATGLIVQHGNVGIGTTEPEMQLDVNGDVLIRSTDGAGLHIGETGGYDQRRILLGYNSNGDYAEIQSWKRASFFSSPKNLILQRRGGNVGIGTTTPTQKLDVGFGNVSANDYWIQAANDGAGQWASQVGGSGGGGCNWTGWRCVCGANTSGTYESGAVIAFQCSSGVLNDIRFRHIKATGGNYACPTTPLAKWGCDSYVYNNF